jgi:triosephosphate isomerase
LASDLQVQSSRNGQRRLLVGSNWKMNKTTREARRYAVRLVELIDGLARSDAVRVFVLPPFTALEAVRAIAGEKIWVGAQNMHWTECGPYTGEISAPMLGDVGVDLVQIGHAERRIQFQETDEIVNRKTLCALRFNIRPLICVGETRAEKESGNAEESVVRQVLNALSGIERRRAAEVMLAYEPQWAIGCDRAAAEPGHVWTVAQSVRGALARSFGCEAAESIPILYGGDVNNSNARRILMQGGVDGLFVGRAASSPEGLAAIIRTSLEAIDGQESNQRRF